MADQDDRLTFSVVGMVDLGRPFDRTGIVPLNVRYCFLDVPLELCRTG